jgi:hypothetical protein
VKPLGGMPNRVRLNVWCRRCEDDGRRDQGLLGQVQVSPDGVVLWATADPQRERHLDPAERRLTWHAATVLTTPALSTHDVPERLVAVCPYHGVGTVPLADITGRTGRISLYLNASA